MRAAAADHHRSVREHLDESRRELGEDQVPRLEAQCVEIDEWQLESWKVWSTRNSKWQWYGHYCYFKIYAQEDNIKITQWNRN